MDNKGKFRKARKSILFISTCLLILLYIVKIYNGVFNKVLHPDSNIVLGIENPYGGSPIGEITEGMQVSQSFFSPRENLRGFSIRFATYARANNCLLQVDLIDVSSNTVVYSEIVDGTTIVDNSYRDFMFESLSDSNNRVYNIVITSVEASAANAITLYVSSYDTYEDGEFAINGKPCGGDTFLKVYFESETAHLLNQFTKALFVLSGILFIVCTILYLDDLLVKFCKQVYFILSITALLLISSLITLKSNESDWSISLSLNYRALLLLLIEIFVIVLSEKKLCYCQWLKHYISKEITVFINLEKIHSSKLMLLHLLTSAFNVATVVYFVVFISFCWDKTYSLLMFFLCLPTVILNTFDQIFIRENRPEKIFLIVSLLIGAHVAYSIPVTSGVSYDDVIHYERAVIVRNVLFDQSCTTADSAMMSNGYTISGYINDPKTAGYILVADNEEQLFPMRTFNLYAYLPYIPPAIMMAIVDAVGGNFFEMVVLSKFINSVLYSVIVYLGLKRLKSGVYLLASVSLMPLMLYLSAQFTCDYWINAFIIYAFAYLISEMQQPEHIISRKDSIVMIGAVVIGCAPKAIYCISLLPFLFLSKEKFKDRKTYIHFIFTCIAMLTLILLSFIYPFLCHPAGASDFRGGADVGSAGQLSFILSHPIEYSWILIKYISEYLSLNTFMSWIGQLGYLGNSPSMFATICTFIIGFCIFVDKSQYDRFPRATKFKLIILSAFFIQVVFICTALYISFTPVGLDTVNGVQYRYVFPILFPLLYVIGSTKIVSEINSRILSFVVFGGMSLSAFGALFSTYLVSLI